MLRNFRNTNLFHTVYILLNSSILGLYREELMYLHTSLISTAYGSPINRGELSLISITETVTVAIELNKQ